MPQKSIHLFVSCAPRTGTGINPGTSQISARAPSGPNSLRNDHVFMSVEE